MCQLNSHLCHVAEILKFSSGRTIETDHRLMSVLVLRSDFHVTSTCVAFVRVPDEYLL